jgi:hypothetical protein
MTASIVGRVSIGQVVPTTATLITSALADAQARLTGAIAAQAHIGITPPSIVTSIAAAAELLAQLTASAALGVPGVEVDFTAMVAVIAQLQLQVSALIALNSVLGTAGIYVITHTGEVRAHGSEMQAKVSEIAPPTNAVQSVTFLATEPAVFAALSKVLLTG